MLFLSETMGQSELLTRILAHPFLFIAIILLVKVAIIIGLIWLAAKANSEEFDYEEKWQNKTQKLSIMIDWQKPLPEK